MLSTSVLFALAVLHTAARGPVDYARDVKPVLAARCYACHGALKQEAGLRLDTAAAIRGGGDSGPAVVPGQPMQSLMVERVADTHADSRMPPAEEGAPLQPAQIDALRAWIEQGAVGPAGEQPEADPRDHWAFRPPTRPPVPAVQNPHWTRNPIDAFIAAGHEAQGLVPQPPTDKRLLLRRVYLDLTGLPPTIAELEAFVADDSPNAYDQVVERLLKSPHYGERWGRHWMDIWRYSDWWGLGAEVRNSQKHIWHWRDWIVESLNADVGYDEMLRQMLAADELYPDDLSKLRATGYLARQYFKFNRNSWLDETVEHTWKSFLGLTLNCTRCHDHKYDPWKQQDYYRFRAFFEPYQIRTDQVPGELDYEKDGIPRAFDGHLDAPTYLFVRGDEKRPRKDEPLTPDLPALLRFTELQIEPVSLPATAHQPGLRPWVLENHLAQAETQIVAARNALETARANLVKSESLASSTTEAPLPDESTAAAARPLVQDDFSEARPDTWEQLGGDWKFEGGRLLQQRDGAERAVLRLKSRPPADFQVRFRFEITGGQMWKSVGVTFDTEGQQEILAYLSAYAGGSKVQLAYKQGADYTYPGNAAQARTVQLGEPQELLLRVRGTLVNVSINGTHSLAWHSPLPRQPGRIELITFDAQAAFTGFELADLPPSETMVDAAAPKMPSVAESRAAVIVAEKALAAAELLPASLRARAAADRARYQQPPAENAQALGVEAARSERLIAQARAAEELARAELELVPATAAQAAEGAKKVAAAREALIQATAALEQPGEQYSPLPGGLKTVESPTETNESRNQPFPASSTGRRTALARWLTDRRHPLVARVAVNHIWGRHFNAPLVPTVFDFGRKGAAPTHPELLDWLAVELMDHGWSMRHIHRLIVTSTTYRMSSSNSAADANRARDGENRYFWRMNPTRMEAQVVRDALLCLSGELDRAVGGPSIPTASAESSRRRSLYFVHSHNDHDRFLSVFDDAGVLECYRREQSIVPQQALALSNSRQALAAAARIADQLQPGAEGWTDDEFIRRAFLAVLANAPTAEELRLCRDAMAEWAAAAQAASAEEAQRRARQALVHSLLNHNDFVTVR